MWTFSPHSVALCQSPPCFLSHPSVPRYSFLSLPVVSVSLLLMGARGGFNKTSNLRISCPHQSNGEDKSCPICLARFEGVICRGILSVAKSVMGGCFLPSSSKVPAPPIPPLPSAPDFVAHPRQALLVPAGEHHPSVLPRRAPALCPGSERDAGTRGNCHRRGGHHSADVEPKLPRSGPRGSSGLPCGACTMHEALRSL